MQKQISTAGSFSSPVIPSSSSSFSTSSTLTSTFTASSVPNITYGKTFHRFSLVETTNEHGIKLRFFITKAPNDTNIDQYITELKRNNVKHIARVCQPTYNKDLLKQEGITVHDMYFNDGKTPPPEIQMEWHTLVQEVFYHAKEGDEPAIAVHCVAGLGRAPVMVAIALIDDGMPNVESIKHIRNQVPGSFNQAQIKFLMAFKPTKKKCIIM